jgi:cell division transport system permease protein
LTQALGYFVREAALSLRRGWKVSLLAVLTIATSLFVGGFFLLVAHNLAAAARSWRSQARIVAYLAPEVAAQAGEDLAVWLRRQPGVATVRVVGGAEARERLREGFPGLADLLDAPGGAELPTSLEISLAATVDRARAEGLAADLRARPGVDVVDDDRDWLGRLDRWAALGRLAGLAVAGLLLAAAVFTIYSVLRLTAHLYRDEIAVMRLVGATEVLIRGPFYLEGLLQGLMGGTLALGSLSLLHFGFRRAAPGLLTQVLVGRFLPAASCLALVAVGAFAGLLGAILSLRREVLAELEASRPLPG